VLQRRHQRGLKPEHPTLHSCLLADCRSLRIGMRLVVDLWICFGGDAMEEEARLIWVAAGGRESGRRWKVLKGGRMRAMRLGVKAS
jgi:hypothetical protein